MARLQMYKGGRLHRWFELAPLLCYPGQPSHAYEVRCGLGDEVRLCYQYDVNDWQFNHSHLDAIAETLMAAADLAAMPRTKGAAIPAIYQFLDWLHVLVLHCPLRSQPDGCIVKVFVQRDDGRAGATEGSPCFEEWAVGAPASAVGEFGATLSVELRAARKLRIELGMATEEDKLLSEETQ